jgi:hypothetical protein
MTQASNPQPKPLKVPGGKAVIDMVLSDIAERAQFGYVKYGTLLQAQNGRDALWDAYQEAIDLVMYLRQELARREEPKEKVVIEISIMAPSADPSLG